MPLTLIRTDIVRVRADAIVNAANSALAPGGGVCGAIFAAAGYDELRLACRAIGHCDVGGAVLTPGFRLPARYVIHAVGPIWRGGACGEEALLRSAYRSALTLAVEHGCQSIAFPLISAGIYGYPKQEAFRVAVGTIQDFLLEHELEVSLILFERSSVVVGEKLYRRIQSYIDDHYVEEHRADRRTTDALFQQRQLEEQREALPASLPPERKEKKPFFGLFSPKRSSKSEKGASPAPSAPRGTEKSASAAPSAPREAESDWRAFSPPSEDESFDTGRLPPLCGSESRRSLEDLVQHLDASFSELLLRLIDKKGMTDVEVYKRANLDRKLFSKLRKSTYRPGKQTAIALAIALRLNLDETTDLLARAGYALSPSSRGDVIVRYFIEEGVYDIFTVNEALFSFGEKLLGA